MVVPLMVRQIIPEPLIKAEEISQVLFELGEHLLLPDDRYIIAVIFSVRYVVVGDCLRHTKHLPCAFMNLV
jgi:hypothetical protein